MTGIQRELEAVKRTLPDQINMLKHIHVHASTSLTMMINPNHWQFLYPYLRQSHTTTAAFDLSRHVTCAYPP